MNSTNDSTKALSGYELIGKLASEASIPSDEMIGFILDLVKEHGLKAEDLKLNDFRSLLLNYISELETQAAEN